MAQVTQGPIKEVLFGFNLQALLVRVDFDTPARTALADFDALRIGFVEPAGWELLIEKQSMGRHRLRLVHEGLPVWEGEAPAEPGAAVEVGIDRIFEAALPFALLGVQADEVLQFFVELVQGGQSRDRAPREGAIQLTCPSPDFERIMWQV